MCVCVCVCEWLNELMYSLFTFVFPLCDIHSTQQVVTTGENSWFTFLQPSLKNFSLVVKNLLACFLIQLMTKFVECRPTLLYSIGISVIYMCVYIYRKSKYVFDCFNHEFENGWFPELFYFCYSCFTTFVSEGACLFFLENCLFRYKQ